MQEQTLKNPAEVPLKELPGGIQKLLSGHIGTDLSREAAVDMIEAWLVWSQGNNLDSRQQWLYLVRSGHDRDGNVLDLWRSIDREGRANHMFKVAMTNDEDIPWEYFSRHFFNWFLGRFNLPAARRVFTDSDIVAGLHYPFTIGALVALTIAFIIGNINLVNSLAILLVTIILVGVASWAVKIPKYAYIHSLIPRLGAAIGIGYLFLASAPHLIKIIVQSSWTLLELSLISAALVGVALLYVAVHISRRVYPQPPWPRLFWLGSDIMVLAIGYAALGLLLFAPLLFSTGFIADPGQECPVQATPGQQILCAAIALILGIVLQLAWDEKPLTEPL